MAALLIRRNAVRRAAAIVLLGIPTSIYAGETDWKDPTAASGGPVDGNFNNSLNWSGGAPVASSTVNFYYSAGSPRVISTALSSDTTVVAMGVGANAQVSVDLAGHNLSVYNSFTPDDPNYYTDSYLANISSSGKLTLTNSGTAGFLGASQLIAADGAQLTLTGQHLNASVQSFEIGEKDGSIPEVTHALATATLANGAILKSTGDINIGASKDGALSVEGGAHLLGPNDDLQNVYYSGGQITIGARDGYSGTATVKDANSLMRSLRIVVGGYGAGTLNVLDGGSVQTRTMFLGYFNTGTSSSDGGTLNINGGTVSVIDLQQGAGKGTVNVPKGELDITGSAYLPRGSTVIGNGTDAATLALSGSGSYPYKYFDDLQIAAGATLKMTDGSLYVNHLGGAGSFIWTGGAATFNDAQTVSPASVLGNNIVLEGSGKYAMSVSTLTVDGATSNVTVRDGGRLTAYAFSLTNGGQLTYEGGALFLPNTDLNSGSILNSSTALSAGRSIGVRKLTVDPDSAVTISGGKLGAATLDLSASGASVVLTSGGISVNNLIAGPDKITQTGGLLSTGNFNTNIYSAPVTLGLNSGLQVSTLTVDPSRGVTVNGGSLSAFALSSGSGVMYGAGSISVYNGNVDFGTPVGTDSSISGAGGSIDLAAGMINVGLSTSAVNQDIKITGGSLYVGKLLPGTGRVSFGPGAGTLAIAGSSGVTLDSDHDGVFAAGMPSNARISSPKLTLQGSAPMTIASGMSISTPAFKLDTHLSLTGGSLVLGRTIPSSYSGAPGDDYETLDGVQFTPNAAFSWTGGTLGINGPFGETEKQEFLSTGNVANGLTLQIGDLSTNLDVSGTLSADDFRGSGTTIHSGGVARFDLVTSGLITVESGGTLDITRLFGGSVDAKPGSTYRTHYYEYTGGSISGDITGDNINLAANATLPAGVKAIGVVNIAHGSTLSGGGNSDYDVQNTLHNAGVLSPGHSPSKFTVKGNYIQDFNGVFKAELTGGTTAGTDFDQLDVTYLDDAHPGNASLNGALDLVTLNSYLGKLNDSFLIVDAMSLSGGFNSLDFSQAGLLNPAKTQWSLYYDYANGDVYAKVVTLASPQSSGNSFVPEPGSISMLLAGGLMLARRRRR